MDYQRWAQIEELLQLALDLGPGERAAFLERACAGDEALRSAVEDLLGREAEAESFLESPAFARADDPVVVPPPSRISHYRIEARIGKGGMGEVYKARDETLRRVVALKMLPAEFTSDPQRVRRFEQEAFAASRLNHPNIITIFEITQAGGAHFIVQEFVEGQTLRELLTDPPSKKPRKLGVDRTLEIGTQVAGALKAAHTAWIIHRDIKPENIMVREDGLVKVLDFGIAKLGEEQAGDSPARRHGEEGAADGAPPHAHAASLTVPGTIMGTASYMSPEQARGEQLDGRTDLFSLGLLLYEMATGERLLTGTTRAEALQSAQRVKEVLSPNARLGQVPKELQRIIRRALRRDREQRYASAGEMLDDLSRLKRRLENRTARRVIGLSALAVAAALTVAVIAAFLSVSEVWEERVLRDGHTAAVRRAVFSPDGRLLVSAGEDQQVIVWDFPRRERLKTFTDHTGVVNAVAFSPDGRWFATGSNDHTVIVWDAARLEKAAVLREHGDPVLSVTFSPDGRLLVSASEVTIVRETGGWKKVCEFPGGGYAYGNHVFLENGRRLADISGRTWDLSTGQKVRDAQEEWFGNWVAISPDGTRWVSVDAGGNVKFVDLARQKSLALRHTHHDHGRSVAFSPDGRLVATAAERVILWDTATRAKIVPLEYESIVWSVAFSPDGRWLVSAHGDGAILAWSVAERELAANLREHSGGVRAVAFSPDGRRLASASEDKSVIVWGAEGERKEAVLDGHQTRVTAVAFSPDGRRLASADHSGAIILWDEERRAPRVTFKPPGLEYSYCLAISPDGRSAATTYAAYDLETGRPLIPRGGTFWSRVYSAVFSADGRLLIGVTDLGEIIFVNARTWQLLERQKVVDAPLISLSLSPDGRYLVTGDDGKAVRLWAIEPLRQVGVIGRHEARVKSVAFSPDGKQVASAGDDKMIALWDVSRRTLINTIGTHTSPVYSIAFSPDGRRLVSGEHDRSVRVYTRHRTLWGFRLN
ncbi:MAG TPA: serine/threonine-protein kinase [Pyrinomonadaceae bacterium]|nr:serine/threonine-protein kinase [Pyrinomonadaceae bacterium]